MQGSRQLLVIMWSPSLWRSASRPTNTIVTCGSSHRQWERLVEIDEQLVKALRIVGIDSSVRREGDRLCREIDPDFDAHRDARWAARPCALSY